MISFDDFLNPLSRSAFMSQYWDRLPVHIANKTGRKFAELPGLDEFPSLFSGTLTPTSWNIYGEIIQASWTDRSGSSRTVVAPAAQAGAFYSAGASVCFSDVHTRHPALLELVGEVARFAAHAGEILTTAYLTPPRASGAMHFDSQHVFLCQTSGAKHWKISRTPALKWPPRNLEASYVDDPHVRAAVAAYNLDFQSPGESEFMEIVLNEGDILYMPPGVWHEQHTTDTHSLHYTLTLIPVSMWTIVSSFMARKLMTVPEWRRDLRFSDAGSESDETIVERLLSELRIDLAGQTARDLLAGHEEGRKILKDILA
jgi:ribosomal protein L16 Arg81 hydroxylase